MKNMVKVFLIFLTYIPISSVAVAAQAKVSEIEGENQTSKLLEYARSVRARLLPEGHFAIDQATLRSRYSKLTGLQGSVLEQNLAQDIQFLVEGGYLHVNEKFLVASSPSQAAM